MLEIAIAIAQMTGYLFLALVGAIALTLAVFVWVFMITICIDSFRASRRNMTLNQYYATFERNQL